MEEPGGLQFMGSQRVGHDWTISLSHSLSSLWWNYLPITFPHYMGSRNCFPEIKILSSTSLVLNMYLVKVIYRDWVIWFPVQYSYCDSTAPLIISLGTRWKMGTKQRLPNHLSGHHQVMTFNLVIYSMSKLGSLISLNRSSYLCSSGCRWKDSTWVSLLCT